ncbi:hypothetical protein BV22DRAFT_1051360 [Leucogyrophana mollusca]|uniref:Uncharacterized protein n=1 Tax=Leucogyrophana mollusca TaxID=85980 RepID=A0ACB8B0F8_9AGAM|nr:hypothetical protein BV22DRAFT_1051360 [Leucogyrophana mollusca]
MLDRDRTRRNSDLLIPDPFCVYVGITSWDSGNLPMKDTIVLAGRYSTEAGQARSDAAFGGVVTTGEHSNPSNPFTCAISAAAIYDHRGTNPKSPPIPPPSGALSKPGTGGYSLKDKLRWDSGLYRDVQNSIRYLCHQHLDVTRPYHGQSPIAKQAFCDATSSQSDSLQTGKTRGNCEARTSAGCEATLIIQPGLNYGGIDVINISRLGTPHSSIAPSTHSNMEANSDFTGPSNNAAPRGSLYVVHNVVLQAQPNSERPDSEITAKVKLEDVPDLSEDNLRLHERLNEVCPRNLHRPQVAREVSAPPSIVDTSDHSTSNHSDESTVVQGNASRNARTVVETITVMRTRAVSMPAHQAVRLLMSRILVICFGFFVAVRLNCSDFGFVLRRRFQRWRSFYFSLFRHIYLLNSEFGITQVIPRSMIEVLCPNHDESAGFVWKDSCNRQPVSIHRQQFPLYRPLNSDVVEIKRRDLDVDEVPVHRQCFPLIRQSAEELGDSQASDISRNCGATSEPIGPSATAQGAVPRVTSEPIEHSSVAQGAVPRDTSELIGPSSASQNLVPRVTAVVPHVVPVNLDAPRSDRPSGQAHSQESCQISASSNDVPTRGLVRLEHKIRNIDFVMGWYTQAGAEPLERPPACPQVRRGDIFVYDLNGVYTAWLWDNGQWKQAHDNEPHPLLEEHRLRMLVDGTPSWVTRQTMSTYRGRQNKRGKGEVVDDADLLPPHHNSAERGHQEK